MESPPWLEALERAFETTRASSLLLEDLARSGWHVTSNGPRLIVLPLMNIDGPALRDVLRLLGEVVAGSTIVLRGADFSVEVNVVGSAIAATCQRDMDGSDSEVALAAVDAGDTDQLWELQGGWSGELNINLGIFLERVLPAVEWRIVREPAVMADAIESSHWYEAHQWFGAGRSPLAVIATATEQSDTFSTDRLVAASLACTAADVAKSLARVLAGTDEAVQRHLKRRQITGRSEAKLVMPDFLCDAHVLDSDMPAVGIWTGLRNVLLRFAGAHALAWLSSGIVAPGWPSPTFDVRAPETGNEGSDRSRVLIMGLQRVALDIAPEGIDERAAVEAVKLHNWAVADQSPDRVLAVRQVLSLAEPQHALDDLSVVRMAAEPLYLGLRRDTIDAVYQNQRQARQLAMDAAQRTVEVAQSTTKSAAERVLAALAGIGGLALAQASSTVPTDLARRLGELVAGYLGAVALWTLCIEGSLLMAPLSVLAEDLQTVGDLLTDVQRGEITGLASVRSARSRARIVRYLTPALYVLAALFVVALSVPSFGRLVHVKSLFT
jgi:hypothetical protein